jgi:hypothetical protein
MTKTIKEEFLEKGFIMPDEILPSPIIDRMKEISDEIILNRPLPTSSKSKFNTHLKLPLNLKENIFLRLACHPLIVNYLKEILGENINLWHSHIYIKDSAARDEVRWHQDSFYFSLLPKEAVTVWINLNDNDSDNGSMIFIPKYQTEEYEHVSENDNIAFKYYIDEKLIDNSQQVLNVRAKGQFSIHDIKTVHRSKLIEDRFVRNTIIFRYIPSYVFYDEQLHKKRLISEFKKSNLILSENDISAGCIVVSGKNLNENNNVLATVV